MCWAGVFTLRRKTVFAQARVLPALLRVGGPSRGGGAEVPLSAVRADMECDPQGDDALS